MADLFSSETFRRVTDAARAGAAAAYEKGVAAATVAGKYASDATEAAMKTAHHAAQQAAREVLGGSAALALVGQTVTIKGRPLVIESLIAEGAWGSRNSSRFPRARSSLRLRWRRLGLPAAVPKRFAHTDRSTPFAAQAGSRPCTLASRRRATSTCSSACTQG
jgi:hypothetical protein